MLREKMLKDGTVTLEKIAEFVGLSVDEVKNIKIDQDMWLLVTSWELVDVVPGFFY